MRRLLLLFILLFLSIQLALSQASQAVGSRKVQLELEDPEMNSVAHISHFGALKTSGTHPIIAGNFPGTVLDSSIWIPTTANGGTITVERGVGRLISGTNPIGSVSVQSVKIGDFIAGQVSVFQSGVYAGAPETGNQRRWGLMDSLQNNGLFFFLDSDTFKVVARAGGVDTEVKRVDFSGDTTFIPSNANNTYRIHYSAGIGRKLSAKIHLEEMTDILVRVESVSDNDTTMTAEIEYLLSNITVN